MSTTALIGRIVTSGLCVLGLLLCLIALGCGGDSFDVRKMRDVGRAMNSLQSGRTPSLASDAEIAASCAESQAWALRLAVLGLALCVVSIGSAIVMRPGSPGSA